MFSFIRDALLTPIKVVSISRTIAISLSLVAASHLLFVLYPGRAM